MDFRGFLRTAGDLSADMSMDPSSMGAESEDKRRTYQPDPSTDGMDPATPGGPAPYNSVEPFGQPVATDPLLPTPQGHEPGRKNMPFTGPGPDVDTTTLHNARLASYERKNVRNR